MIHFSNLTLSILTTCPIHLVCGLVSIVSIVGQFALSSTILLLNSPNFANVQKNVKKDIIQFNMCE